MIADDSTLTSLKPASQIENSEFFKYALELRGEKDIVAKEQEKMSRSFQESQERFALKLGFEKNIIESVAERRLTELSLNARPNEPLQLFSTNLQLVVALQEMQSLKDPFPGEPDPYHGDTGICAVCLSVKVSHVFTNCGHMSCCGDCAVQVKDCPMCRKSATGIRQVYIHG